MKARGRARIAGWFLTALVASLLAAPGALAAPPSNDSATGAEALADGPYPVLSSTVDVTDATTTDDPPHPSCTIGAHERSVWFKVTPSQAASYRLSTAHPPTNTTVTDTVIAVYTSAGGAAGPFTELPTSLAAGTVGCNNDDPSGTDGRSSVSTKLSAGTEYWIVVWSFDSSVAPGNVQLRIDQVPPPANDSVAGATELRLNRPVSGNMEAAANDYTLSGSTCYSGVGQTASTASGPDLVYSFTAPAAGSYGFRAFDFNNRQPSTSVSHVVYVASALPSASPSPQNVNATCLAAANRSIQAIGASEEVSPLALTAGQQVFVVVDQASANTLGTFELVAERSVPEVEPNDTPATASAQPSCGLRGTISASTDADFFSLGNPTVGSRLFAMADGQAASSTNFDMRVTTAVDTVQYDDRSLILPFGGLAPSVAGVPLSAQPTYIRVNHAAAAEPYRLYSVLQPPAANAKAEVEPNDESGLATAAGPGGYVSGTISSTELDVFSFTLPARTLVYIGLDLDPLRNNTPVDGSLTLLDPSGLTTLVQVDDKTLTSSTASGAGSLTATTPNSPSEGIVYRSRAAGTYYVRVGAAAAGDYLLSIAPNCRAGAAPQIDVSPSALPNAAPGTAYNQSLSAAGGTGPYEFELASGSLPAGITLASDGTLSGTTNQTGTFTFIALATDGNEFTGERQYTLDVKAQPGISTSASPGVPVGGQVHATATLSAGQAPGGTITFRLFGPDDPSCSNAAVTTSTRNVDSGNGDYVSDSFTPTQPGTYRWVAGYSGDAVNEPVTSSCGAGGGSVVVSKAQPTLSVVASGNIEVGGRVHATAALAGGHTPGGTITFWLYGPDDANCSNAAVATSTPNVDAGNGSYVSADASPARPGTYRWVAAYSGDGGNEQAATACGAGGGSVVVSKAQPTLAAATSGDTELGGPVRATATLAGGHAPVGAITFRLYGPDDASCSNAALTSSTRAVDSGNGSYVAADFTPAQPGVYRWVADYSGDEGNLSGTTACGDANQSVSRAIVPPPSNRFSLGKPRLDKTKGTATLPVKVPGAGALRLTARGIKTTRTRPARAGSVLLRVRPAGTVARQLRKKGVARAKVKVTFTPGGGTAASKSKTVVLKRQRPKRGARAAGPVPSWRVFAL